MHPIPGNSQSAFQGQSKITHTHTNTTTSHKQGKRRRSKQKEEALCVCVLTRHANQAKTKPDQTKKTEPTNDKKKNKKNETTNQSVSAGFGDRANQKKTKKKRQNNTTLCARIISLTSSLSRQETSSHLALSCSRSRLLVVGNFQLSPRFPTEPHPKISN